MDNVPTLGLINHAYEPVTIQGVTDYPAVLWLKIQIDNLFDFFEQPLGVTQRAVEECAQLIISRYYYLNLFEIELFLAECKLNGKFYGVTGCGQLLEYLRQYVIERNNDIGKIEDERNQQRREQERRFFAQNKDKFLSNINPLKK